MKTLKSPVRIGILGGGQLARMLALKAHSLGIEPWVLSTRSSDPAAQVSRYWQTGDINSVKDVEKFFKQVELVTFESEFIDAKMLENLRKKTKVKILPQPLLMSNLQDRLTQKQSLLRHQIPTAHFIKIDSFESLIQAGNTLGFPLVLKKRRFGYDGYGTFVIKNYTELKSIWSRLKNEESGFIAEEWIKFKRELALIFVRNVSGQQIMLPLVETKQENSICHWVKGPIQLKKITPLAQTIKKYLKNIKYTGVIAFEIFDGRQGLLVNEIAPRVHNSGHYSIDGLVVDQFEYHLRAILDLNLPVPQLVAPGFAMVNLLGGKRKKACWKLDSQVHFHWYGKHENRPGRKMGHINILSNSSTAALRKALLLRKDFSL